MVEAIERIEAHGHSEIRGTHRSTFEFTREEHLTSRGDCIVAVRANKGFSELSEKFKRLAARDSARITILIEVDQISEVAVGRGSGLLTFCSDSDIVARKSTFTCDRTVMVESNKAALDFNRDLIRSLRNPDTIARITIAARI